MSPQGDPFAPSDAVPDPVPVAEPRSRLKKSPSAFRTISEVADDLNVHQHVLRFWETKFPQVRPLKRGGGRRYYRPEDIVLLRRISDLLYVQGFTIKGVQRLLREGNGRLSDNIPPPTGDERETAIERQPDLLVPSGLAAEPGSAPAELHRLREILHRALTELEALRALLP